MGDIHPFPPGSPWWKSGGGTLSLLKKLNRPMAYVLCCKRCRFVELTLSRRELLVRCAGSVVGCMRDSVAEDVVVLEGWSCLYILGLP